MKIRVEAEVSPAELFEISERLISWITRKMVWVAGLLAILGLSGSTTAG